MYNSFLYGVVKFYTRSCFTWTSMWDDDKKIATIRDQFWMNVALRASFQIPVEKPNLNQFQKFEVYKREYVFLT